MLSSRPNSFKADGQRAHIIPAPVRGFFNTRRNFFQGFLVLFFLLLPWTKINGLQTLQFDIPAREFKFFGTVFFAHDTPLIFLLLLTFASALILSTALFGRVWCGWACPQTVFIDFVYRWVERKIEGSYITQRNEVRSPTIKGQIKKVIKWLAFLGLSSIIAHSFIAYFAGSEALIAMIQHNPFDNQNYFALVTFFTLLFTFNFGWFKEQFCLVVCPYGRFQSVLTDEETVLIRYDENRNDCVKCKRCVEVCPTGIDIREGIQMECISCTACIDACDDIMRKVHKPEKLITYKTSVQKPINYLRGRVLGYFGLFIFSITTLAFLLNNRTFFKAEIFHSKQTPVQMLSDGKVANHFYLRIMNQTQEPLELELIPEENPELTWILPMKVLTLESHKTQELHFFINFEKTNNLTKNVFELKLQNKKTHEVQIKKINLLKIN